MNQGIIMEYPTNEILIHGECYEHITKFRIHILIKCHLQVIYMLHLNQFTKHIPNMYCTKVLTKYLAHKG